MNMERHPKENNNNEFSYFHTFIKETQYEYEKEPEFILLELAKHVMEVTDIVLSRPHDIDGIRFKCGQTLIKVFYLCENMENLSPCLPTDPSLTNEQGNLFELVSKLQTISKSVIENFLNTDIFEKVWRDKYPEKFHISESKITELYNIYKYPEELHECKVQNGQIHSPMVLRPKKNFPGPFIKPNRVVYIETPLNV